MCYVRYSHLTSKVFRSSTGNREGSVLFYLKLKVDGVDVDTPYTYLRYDERYTPYLRKVATNNSLPNYGAPGQMVTLEGRFFTKDYGNLNIGDEEFGKVSLDSLFI